MAKLTKTVLIVDDEAESRSLLREILVAGGYGVLEASDGQTALELFEKQKIHLLIVDRAMPGMSGLELLSNLRQKEIKVPAVIVSAYGEESFWGQAIGLGAMDYLLKPFQADEVLKLAHKALNGAKPA